MPKLRKLAVIVGGSLLALLLIGLALPNHWEAQATLTIQAKPEHIYESVANLRKWREWSAWNDAADPDCKHVYEGPDSGIGAKWIWDGPVLSNGSLTIVGASTAKGITYDLVFEAMEPSRGAVEFEADGDQTLVRQRVAGTFNGVFGGWMAMLLPMLMKGQFHDGLEGLKTRIESMGAGTTANQGSKKKGR
jgi:hypothetical protein